MPFDVLSLLISFTGIFGIYSILAVSLNLEYGFAGQPNFGQVLFFGIGAYMAGLVSANLIKVFSSVPSADICSGVAFISRQSIAYSDPLISGSTWILGILFAMIIASVLGYLASYPALRIKEEWYLAMILFVAGETFRIVVGNTPQFLCGYSGIGGLIAPFAWIPQFLHASPVGSEYQVLVYVSSGLYAAVILALALLCYYFVQRLVDSPFGRILKSVRDDPVASQSSGKNITKVRWQVMMIGSAMAGLAGALYAYYVGVAISDDYIPTVTITIWVMIALGGMGNNKGAIIGALALTALDRGTLLLGIELQNISFSFNPAILDYARYMVEALLLIALLIFRPKGLVPEQKVVTVAYSTIESQSKSEG